MAVVRENLSTGSGGSSTTHTINFGFTATAGRLLVIGFGNSGSASTFSSYSPFSLVHEATGTRNMSAAMIYKVAAGGETSASVTLNASAVLEWIVSEYSGLDTSAPLDQSAENEANQTGSTVTSLATGTTAALATATGYAISFWAGDAASWPGGSYTFAQGSSTVSVSGTTLGLLMAQLQLASASGFAETVQNTAADQVYGMVAVFKQASAGGGGTLQYPRLLESSLIRGILR